MPGKYLEYIKSGRFIVPIELTFLNSPLTDELTRKQEYTSKWANRDDWKEIKDLLHAGVVSCVKYNDSLSDRIPKSTNLAFGQRIGLGYTLVLAQDPALFDILLDSKDNCWTDDEDDEDDVPDLIGKMAFESSNQTLTPTTVHLKVVVVRKTFSTLEDERRIQGHVGTPNEEIIREWEKSPALESLDGIGVGQTRGVIEETPLDSFLLTKENVARNSMEVQIGGRNGWGIRTWKSSLAGVMKTDTSFWGKNPRKEVEGSYYEEKDEDNEEVGDEDDDEDGLVFPDHDLAVPTPPNPFFRNSILDAAVDDDDDDTFSLPDIVDTPLALREAENVEKRYSEPQAWSPVRQGRTLSTDGHGHAHGSFSAPPLDFTNLNFLLRPQPTNPKHGLAHAHVHHDSAHTPTNSFNHKRKADHSHDSSSPSKSSPKKGRPSTLTPSPKKSTKEKSMKFPVYFNKEKKKKGVKEKVKAKAKVKEGRGHSPTKDKDTTPKKSGTPVVTKRKRLQRKRKDVQTSTTTTTKTITTLSPTRTTTATVPEIDPEMPVLEKMVYYTEPTPLRSHSPIRLPKIEPSSVSRDDHHSLRSKVKDATVAPLVTPVVPVKQKKTIRKKQRKKKDEETQTSSSSEKMVDKSEVISGQSAVTPISTESAEVPIVRPQLQLQLHPPTPVTPPTELSEEDDEEANLFSFDHLSKCCNPNVIPKPKVIDPDPVVPDPAPTLPLPSTSPVTASSVLSSMMPPPVRRPPRTPKKSPPPPPPQPPIVPFNPCQFDESRPFIAPRKTTGGTGVHSGLSTYELLTNDKALFAGFGLFNQLASKEVNAEEMGVRLGLRRERAPEQQRQQRAVSPDICEGPIKAKKPEVNSRLRPRTQGTSTTVATNGKGLNLEGRLTQLTPQDRQGGEAMFREIISRCDNTEFRYEPQGDEYDLSQSSFCMVPIYPQYGQKSRTYKMHSKNICELSMEALKENFDIISPQLMDISAERLPSERHELFREGQNERKNLTENLNILVPFNHEQGMMLFNLIADILVPNQLERAAWTYYIRYVMLPECLIRIYSHVNQISFKRADTEMRFGACYDDDSIHQ